MNIQDSHNAEGAHCEAIHDACEAHCFDGSSVAADSSIGHCSKDFDSNASPWLTLHAAVGHNSLAMREGKPITV
jgi:hypothetical protein